MKNVVLVCLAVLFLIPACLYSQVFYLNNGFTNGGNVRSCNGQFKDSNPYGNYTYNETYTVTFQTDSATGQAMQLEFDTLDIAKGDTMFIYDGPSTSAKLVTILTNKDGVPFSIRATALNKSGSLTVKFTSDNNDVSSGWNAHLICKSPCQSISVQLATSPPADANGFINICKGGTITFSGKGLYNQNNLYYHQSDTTAKYLWTFSDGKDTAGIFANQIKRTFTTEGGTIAQLALMDQNECYNTLPVQVKVRTSLTPTFNIKPPSLCINDTTRLVARPAYPEAVFSNLPVYSDNKPLNDGVGKCYETSINVNQFAPLQKLVSINELDGILLNMEHSFLGDITIAITAPNGVKVFLKKQVGTTNDWASFLGEPVDEPFPNSPLASMPGKGYDYLFSPTPTYGTMASEKGKYNYSYIDKAGQSQVNHFYLPEGNYASEENLSALVGTQLNGLWTIEVCDNFKEDNGFIFYWTIRFKPSVYPDSEVYTSVVASQQWFNSPGIVSAKDSVAYISLPQQGIYNYTYRVTDQFGCYVDTTVQLAVHPFPLKPNLGNDALICLGKTVKVTITNPQPATTYTWSTGAVNDTTQTITKAGSYSVTAYNSFGCKLIDTIVIVDNEPIGISLGKDTLYCASNPLKLEPSITGNIASYVWNTGETSAGIITKQAGTFVVTGKTNSGCQVSDSILLGANPADLFQLPQDTIICMGTSYRLTVNTPAGSSFSWDDGFTNNQRLITGGNYALTVNYQGCRKKDEMLVGIQPVPVVNLGADTTICIGFDLPLKVFYPAASYLWNDGSTANNLVARSSGLYWIQTNLARCTFRDSINITQRRCECRVKMPNAFSPNGDGVNDEYKPEISCFPKDYQLSIFNRYGQLLFNTKDFNQYWKGTQKDKPLPVGTYYYILTYFNVDTRQNEQYKGGITLLR
ncbi:MAG: gliding motility-associated C-terminal domain-containing protein [Chitinophagaceae bacterium]|nr:gliding motility-associated C-terminal domain-containing protein [Chitinophagaceae bacterium]